MPQRCKVWEDVGITGDTRYRAERLFTLGCWWRKDSLKSKGTENSLGNFLLTFKGCLSFLKMGNITRCSDGGVDPGERAKSPMQERGHHGSLAL